jgi:hypothetical protein
MSLISAVDRDLAVVYSRLLSVPLRERLLDRGIALVETPDDEFDSMGTNVLALAPRLCLMLAGNPGTRRALERAGATVVEYEGSEISLKGGGGPTCLTRPPRSRRPGVMDGSSGFSGVVRPGRRGRRHDRRRRAAHAWSDHGPHRIGGDGAGGLERGRDLRDGRGGARRARHGGAEIRRFYVFARRALGDSFGFVAGSADWLANRAAVAYVG